jgi:hypothetical protein
MARSLEEVLKAQIGLVCFQNASLIAEIEMLREKLEALAPAQEEKKDVESNPKQLGPKAK